MMQAEIQQEFTGENATEKQKLAEQAYAHGLSWVDIQPKTWCDAQTKQDRREARRERRAKRKQLHEHITSQMADVQPVGFVGSFIFFAILSGIISWCVQRILSHYWPQE